jgi:hypothetical protein
MPSTGGFTGVVADTATCACGQALDCCRGDHCPRCGRNQPTR